MDTEECSAGLSAANKEEQHPDDSSNDVVDGSYTEEYSEIDSLLIHAAGFEMSPAEPDKEEYLKGEKPYKVYPEQSAWLGWPK